MITVVLAVATLGLLALPLSLVLRPGVIALTAALGCLAWLGAGADGRVIVAVLGAVSFFTIREEGL